MRSHFSAVEVLFTGRHYIYIYKSINQQYITIYYNILHLPGVVIVLMCNLPYYICCLHTWQLDTDYHISYSYF